MSPTTTTTKKKYPEKLKNRKKSIVKIKKVKINKHKYTVTKRCSE